MSFWGCVIVWARELSRPFRICPGANADHVQAVGDRACLASPVPEAPSRVPAAVQQRRSANKSACGYPMPGGLDPLGTLEPHSRGPSLSCNRCGKYYEANTTDMGLLLSSGRRVGTAGDEQAKCCLATNNEEYFNVYTRNSD